MVAPDLTTLLLVGASVHRAAFDGPPVAVGAYLAYTVLVLLASVAVVLAGFGRAHQSVAPAPSGAARRSSARPGRPVGGDL